MIAPDIALCTSSHACQHSTTINKFRCLVVSSAHATESVADVAQTNQAPSAASKPILESGLDKES